MPAADAPLPPSDLADRQLPVVETAGPWLRIHLTAYGPLFFGRTLESRFDDPDQEFGVLYAAETLDGAFIETFGRSPGHNSVRQRQLARRSLARIEVRRRLRLVDLTGPGLARIGATAALFAGPHGPAQAWSRALWSHPAAGDGLLNRARHDPSCHTVAIFDRARPLVRADDLGSLIAPANIGALDETLSRYDFSVRP